MARVLIPMIGMGRMAMSVMEVVNVVTVGDLGVSATGTMLVGVPFGRGVPRLGSSTQGRPQGTGDEEARDGDQDNGAARGGRRVVTDPHATHTAEDAEDAGPHHGAGEAARR